MSRYNDPYFGEDDQDPDDIQGELAADEADESMDFIIGDYDGPEYDPDAWMDGQDRYERAMDRMMP